MRKKNSSYELAKDKTNEAIKKVNLAKLMEKDKYCNILSRIAKLSKLDLKYVAGCHCVGYAYIAIQFTPPKGFFFTIKILNKERYNMSRLYLQKIASNITLCRTIQFKSFLNKTELKKILSKLAKEMVYYYFMDVEVFVPVSMDKFQTNNEWKSVIDLDVSTIDELELLLTINGV